MNEDFMWRTAGTRAAELRSEAREARLAGALRRSRRGPGRHPIRVGDLWSGLFAAGGPAGTAGEVCCA